MRRDGGSVRATTSARVRAAVVVVALSAAIYLTYLAVDFMRGGCDCGGAGGITIAGVARATILIGGAALLYVCAAAMAVGVVREIRRR